MLKTPWYIEKHPLSCAVSVGNAVNFVIREIRITANFVLKELSMLIPGLECSYLIASVWVLMDVSSGAYIITIYRNCQCRKCTKFILDVNTRIRNIVIPSLTPAPTREELACSAILYFYNKSLNHACKSISTSDTRNFGDLTSFRNINIGEWLLNHNVSVNDIHK